jgi:hypothetical protein
MNVNTVVHTGHKNGLDQELVLLHQTNHKKTKTLIMKKKMLMLGLAVISLMPLCAQDMEAKQSPKKEKENKMYLALSAGPSFPMGKFGSKSVDPEDGAGFAKTGFDAALQYGYLFDKNFGIAVNIGYSRYRLDEGPLNSMMIVDDPSFKVSADHWQYFNFLAGPMATVAANDKLNFDFRLMGGLAHTNFPVISASTSSSGAKSSENWQSAFAWQVGANARYSLSEKASLFANVDYLKTKPVTEISVTNGGTETSEVEQHLGVMNLTLGVGFSF